MQIKDFKIDHNLKELTEHRTVALPLACYETQINRNIHGYIPLHWHDEIQFILIVEGEAVFQIDDEEVYLEKGEGLFINSGCLHMAKDHNRSGCEYICLNISPDFILPQALYATHVYPYVHATNLTHLLLAPNENWGRNIISAIQEISDNIKQQSTLYEIEIMNQLTIIWKNLAANGFPLKYDHAKMLKSHRMKQMLHWIHQHYAEKILLEDIARVGQLSRSETCRYFKQFLKTSPLNYVIEYRIQKSLNLLQDPEINVTEAAYQIGFNSTSYFINKFRSIMGMTPLAYKKNQRHTNE